MDGERSETPPDGLVAWWLFDAPAASALNLGGTADGVVFGASGGACMVDGAIELLLPGDRVNVPHDPASRASRAGGSPGQPGPAAATV